MKVGVVSAVYLHKPLEEALDEFKALGLHAVEFAAGGFFPKRHCDPGALLSDRNSLTRFQDAVARRELEINALAVHGNPLHPNAEVARAYDRDFQDACFLAEQLGVTRLTLLAGLPASSPTGEVPHWMTWFFPPELSERYTWQWEERVIPHWLVAAKFASDHGVRLCFEMVPGDCVFNPATLLRLRQAAGPAVGCNFDPSHLFFQGIDTIETIHVLGEVIYNVHAKDCQIDPRKVRVDGVLNPRPYADERGRSWVYRTVGYGHDRLYWADFLTALRLAGYDDIVAIEHEDSLMSPEEGLSKATRFLQELVMHERSGTWWGVQ